MVISDFYYSYVSFIQLLKESIYFTLTPEKLQNLNYFFIVKSSFRMIMSHFNYLKYFYFLYVHEYVYLSNLAFEAYSICNGTYFLSIRFSFKAAKMSMIAHVLKGDDT